MTVEPESYISFKGPLFLNIFTGWKDALCVDILVKALHWLTWRIMLYR